MSEMYKRKQQTKLRHCCELVVVRYGCCNKNDHITRSLARDDARTCMHTRVCVSVCDGTCHFKVGKVTAVESPQTQGASRGLSDTNSLQLFEEKKNRAALATTMQIKLNTTYSLGLLTLTVPATLMPRPAPFR